MIIKGLFLDIGGVLMTNGWDHVLQQKTANHFGVDYSEMQARHHLLFETYEIGKLTFEEYLKKIFFFEKRVFTLKEVKKFIFNSVEPFHDMVQYICKIKKEYNLKIGVISNEGRELALDRIKRFDLSSFIDFFVVSSFVHFRKPDPDIYRLAIDIMQVSPDDIVYIDDRLMLIQSAEEIGLKGIHHTDMNKTKMILNKLLKK
ncbi:MAG: HAD-IA family hydrolase [Chlamydiales bacterium]